MKALLLLAIATVCRSDSIIMPVNPDVLPGAFLTGGTNDDAATPCNDVALASCQVGFNNYLNITDSADWTNPAILSHALDTYFTSGVAGLLKVCNARTLFYQCLGTSYSSCINRLYFLQKGYSADKAFAYVEIIKELEFMCGGGLLQAVRSWGCILAVQKNNQDHFRDCTNGFNSTVTQDPNAVCKAAQDLTTCFRFPFIILCGGEVGWWECERIRIAFELGSQCQSLQCHITGNSKDDQQANELAQASDAETKAAKLRNLLHVFPENRLREYERMANNMVISEEEMKLAGAQ